MRELVDEWAFVAAAYAVGIVGTLGMVAWGWITMRRVEKRRDEVKRK